MSGRKKSKVESPKSEVEKKSEIGMPNAELENPYAIDNPQSEIENPTSEITELPTGNSKLQTETMEVHHHPDLHHRPKPWKEYLLEYFMIFLAVMTGFFAESYREHLGDRAKEKDYVVALVSELKNDTTAYNLALVKIYRLIPALDSLYHNINEPARYNYVLQGRWNMPVNQASIAYTPALAIIQQLKSSGNLRLLDKKDVGLQIIKYETFVEGHYKGMTTGIKEAANKLLDLEDALCDESGLGKNVVDNMQHHITDDSFSDVAAFNMPVKIRDPGKLNELANSAINYNAHNWGYANTLISAKKQATALLTLIHKEYNLEDE